MPDRHARFLVLMLLAALASACDQPCPAGTVREPSGRCVVSIVDGGAPLADACSPRAERCGDLRDDDCDRLVDEGCGCELGATAPCGTDVGECSIGLLTCVMDAASSAGTWSACEGETAPETEVCNGLDDDCDGEVDGPAAWPSCGTAPGATDLRCAFSFDTEETCRVFACEEGLQNCDGRAANGCEVDLLSDSANCGSCRRECTRSSVCETGSCQPLPRNGWSTSVAGDTDDVAYTVDVDAAGNVYVAGRFEGTLTLGTTTLPDAGATDGFVASWTSDGEPRWLVGIGGASEAEVLGIAIDAAGSVIVVGSFSGTATFSASVALTSAGASDGFVARYSGAGAVEWARALGGSTGDAARAVAVAADGSLVVGGAFSGSASFGGPTRTSVGATDGFLVGLSGAGAHRWSNRVGGPSTDEVAALAMGASGAVVAAGSFYSTASFGGAAQGSAGFSDVFVASYDAATGAHGWSRGYGGSGADYARALATDTAGNVYLAGVFEGTADFGGGSRTTAGGPDGVLASYSPAGAHRWSERYGGDDYDELAGVAFAAPDRLYATGTTSSGVFYPPGAVLSPLGLGDVLLAAYELDGAHVWSTRVGGPRQDFVHGVAAHGDRAILVGSFEGMAVFAGPMLTAAGGEYDADVFVASLRGR